MMRAGGSQTAAAAALVRVGCGGLLLAAGSVIAAQGRSTSTSGSTEKEHGPLFCQKNHPLQSVWSGTTHSKSAAVRAPVCDCCRNPICSKTIEAAHASLKKPILYCCPECDYDVCTSCVAASGTAATAQSTSTSGGKAHSQGADTDRHVCCDKKHPVQKVTTGSTQGKTALDRGATCDTCRKAITAKGDADSSLLYVCNDCDYDLCVDCHSLASALVAKTLAAKDEAAALAQQKKAAEEAAALAQQKKAAEEAAALAHQKKAAEDAAALAQQKKAAEEAAALAQQKKAAEEAAALAQEKKITEEAAALAQQKKAAEEVAALAQEKKITEDAAALAQQKKAAEKEAAAAPSTTQNSYPQCHKSHHLHSIELDSEVGRATALRHPQCDECRLSIAATGSTIHSCAPCDFDLCQSCYKKKLDSVVAQPVVAVKVSPAPPTVSSTPSSTASTTVTPVMCKKNHPMVPSFDAVSNVTRGAKCDGCHENITSPAVAEGGSTTDPFIYTCATCDYDLCRDCHKDIHRLDTEKPSEQVKEQVSPPPTTSTPTAASTATSPANTAAAICPKSHPLKASTDSDHSVARGAVCDRCRNGFDSTSSSSTNNPSIYSCPEEGCDYDLCPSCFEAGGGPMPAAELTRLEVEHAAAADWRRRAMNAEVDTQAQAQSITLLQHKILVAKGEKRASEPAPILDAALNTPQSTALDVKNSQHIRRMRQLETKLVKTSDDITNGSGSMSEEGFLVSLLPMPAFEEEHLLKDCQRIQSEWKQLATTLQALSDQQVVTVKKMVSGLSSLNEDAAEKKLHEQQQQQTDVAKAEATTKEPEPVDVVSFPTPPPVVVEPTPAPSSNNNNLRWSSWDPRTKQAIDYSPVDTAKLESAYLARERHYASATEEEIDDEDDDTSEYFNDVDLEIGGQQFTVDLASMRQTNLKGHSRKVFRTTSPSTVAQSATAEPQPAAGEPVESTKKEAVTKSSSCSEHAKTSAKETTAAIDEARTSLARELASVADALKTLRHHPNSFSPSTVDVPKLAAPRWFFLDSLTRRYIEFSPADSKVLESSYFSPEGRSCKLQVKVDGQDLFVNLRKMKLLDPQGSLSARKVFRFDHSTFYPGSAATASSWVANVTFKDYMVWLLWRVCALYTVLSFAVLFWGVLCLAHLLSDRDDDGNDPLDAGCGMANWNDALSSLLSELQKEMKNEDEVTPEKAASVPSPLQQSAPVVVVPLGELEDPTVVINFVDQSKRRVISISVPEEQPAAAPATAGAPPRPTQSTPAAAVQAPPKGLSPKGLSPKPAATAAAKHKVDKVILPSPTQVQQDKLDAEKISRIMSWVRVCGVLALLAGAKDLY